MTKSKILITGANGVLGNAFKRNKKIFLDYELFYTSGRECDLTNPKECAKLFDKFEPNFVFHLAAKSGGIGFSKEYQATLFRDNLLMAINIADNCVRKKVKKCIFTLSVGMYPENSELPIKESSNLKGKPHPSGTGYAYAKAILEPLIETYSSQYNINFVGLVPNGIYGPEDNFDPEHSAMLPSLIRKAFLSKSNKTPLEVWGDGSQGRAFVHVNDVIKSLELILEKGMNQNVIQIGPSTCTTIREIAELIVTIIPGTGKIIYDKTKPTGDLGRSCNYQKAKSILGWEPTVDLNDGLIDLVSWISSKL